MLHHNVMQYMPKGVSPYYPGFQPEGPLWAHIRRVLLVEEGWCKISLSPESPLAQRVRFSVCFRPYGGFQTYKAARRGAIYAQRAPFRGAIYAQRAPFRRISVSSAIYYVPLALHPSPKGSVAVPLWAPPG